MENAPRRHSPTTPVRVLLADRDTETRSQYREAFRRVGCDVVEASDGREALVEALVRTPSLIVMDTRLPFVNGTALCEILRSDPMTRSVPILALAADGSAEECDHIRHAGASELLVKPVDPATLLVALDRLVSGRISSAEGAAPQSDVQPIAPRARNRKPMSKMYDRFTTTTPPLPVPTLRCPRCDGALIYQHSHVGGVSTRHPEQWDRFECAACGAFEYRHRTRKLRGPIA